MSDRVLNRMGARQLTREEMEQIQGAGTACQATFCNFKFVGDDFQCDPACC